jgi:Skp family chaperone for outer membrane proteins
MKLNHCAFVVCSLVLLFSCGCDNKAANQRASQLIVGMVDLDRVADEIGVNAKYQEYVIAYRDHLKKKLEEVLVPMQQDVDKLQKELKDGLDAIPQEDRKSPDWKPPASVENLYRDLINKQQQMQAERQASEAKLQEYDRKMKQDFQVAIQPALATICESKGVRVLVPRVANLYCHPDADLTSALIAHLKANPILPPQPPPSEQ